MKTALSIIAALSVAMASPAPAQDIVGTAVLGGKKVELLSDNTWRFMQTTGPSTCVAMHSAIEFCGSILNWRPAKATGDFTRVFTYDHRTSAGYIVEDVGTNDGVNPEFMRSLILEYAAEGSEITVEEVPVLGVFDTEIDGHPAETIVYGTRPNGVSFVFANTVFLHDRLTVQAIVWSMGKEYTPELESIHADFIEKTKLTLEDPIQ